MNLQTKLPVMLSSEELTKYILNTPIEYILQTRYDILDINDHRFSPFIHNRSIIFNCSSTECHSEAFTTFILNIIKYYCSDTFCFMIYKYIYEFLQLHLDSTQLYEINIISIIHLFRIISIYSIKSRIIDLYTHNITTSVYTPFDIIFDTNLGKLYKTFFNNISICAYKHLTLTKFNTIVSKFTSTLYKNPIILKASLNNGNTNLHSFTITILDNVEIIISGANGSAKGLCSVTQDNKISVVLFQQYLQVIEDIRSNIYTDSKQIELINKYNKLYNEIFFKNFIIRNIYDETGLTIDQYLMIIIGIYNYIVKTYKSKNISKNKNYITYLQSLQHITQYFQIYNSEINKYKKSIQNIILKIPKMITLIEKYITNIYKKNIKYNNTFLNDLEEDYDENDSEIIFKFILKFYKSTNIFNNTHMYSIILDIITNILNKICKF